MTSQRALIIAHGSPADPEPQERALAALAQAVAQRLPGWQIGGTTLAMPGALTTALAAQPGAWILPFFMAEGWFTRSLLPRRLAGARSEAGQAGPQLPAFGHAPEILPLIAQIVADNGAGPVLLAAHGSQVSRASASRTEELATGLRLATGLQVLTGYVEEDPRLADVARAHQPALCLPLFATRAGHVAQDVPAALDQAGFSGRLLPALGEHTEVPAILAAMLLRAAGQQIRSGLALRSGQPFSPSA